ncbi:hypothetical protein JS44_02945 [Anoxybacillus flavithermus]|uniref:Uncharacterized protein n=1 Tax=Anoxybacillus flavithermus TaxID=33934 RepID=A0A094IXW4_9BACL|nr:hypothetical protein JS44_02945 [Anoxybacillus flavithermus]
MVCFVYAEANESGYRRCSFIFQSSEKEKQQQPHIEVVTALEEKEEEEDETIVVEGPVISNFNEGAEEEKPIVFTQTHETDYALPPIDLLSPPKAVDQSREKESIYENARKLEKRFKASV